MGPEAIISFIVKILRNFQISQANIFHALLHNLFLLAKSLFKFYTLAYQRQILFCTSLRVGHVAEAMFPPSASFRTIYAHCRLKSKV